jgi:hypothetical protein
VRDCRRVWEPKVNLEIHECRKKAWSEYVAPPPYATQVEGQSFFCIPNRSSEVNARE